MVPFLELEGCQITLLDELALLDRYLIELVARESELLRSSDIRYDHSLPLDWSHYGWYVSLLLLFQVLDLLLRRLIDRHLHHWLHNLWLLRLVF